jgi:hypothetical protein
MLWNDIFGEGGGGELWGPGISLREAGWWAVVSLLSIEVFEVKALIIFFICFEFFFKPASQHSFHAAACPQLLLVLVKNRSKEGH